MEGGRLLLEKFKFMHFGTLETASFQIIWELCSSFYAEKERSSPNLFSYETHSAVKRPNAVLCKRMRSATDKSKINSGCMQKHTREKKAASFLQQYRVRVREIEKV